MKQYENTAQIALPLNYTSAKTIFPLKVCHLAKYVFVI